jgi:hypothetical protein
MIHFFHTDWVRRDGISTFMCQGDEKCSGEQMFSASPREAEVAADIRDVAFVRNRNIAVGDAAA